MTDGVANLDDARALKVIRSAIRVDATTDLTAVVCPTVGEIHQARDPIGECQHCHDPILHGQPYMGRIPFVGSWGGFVHRTCRPTLHIIRGGA